MTELTPLIRILEESYADVLTMEKTQFFSQGQYRLKRAENVNMRTRNRWNLEQENNTWKVVDPNYTHLRDEVTRMRMEIHPIDSRTGGVPKPANTVAARARYNQHKCLPAELIPENISPDGELVPDLSNVNLVAAWTIVDGHATITLHKIIDAKKLKSCLDIPLLGNREDQSKIRYEAAPENEMLIPNLIDEETKHSEKKTEAENKG
ncbi:hypothetical protein [Bifidobacterium adolescentis]|uniref:Uncharacterized protein n=1 Tax=Bifidobacterium adolescentis TaxID=1680 RepID=A0A1X2ZMS0_BIFAD|nr:hypothetical protein [Bifidobacterium adolescentis]OSG95636.1 hypothetical protein AD0028_0876 [Bifidobacterium adolescentis]